MVFGEGKGKKAIPIKEGWFHIAETDDDQPYLIGSRCENCGFTTFPKAAACLSCMRDDTMREIHLGPKGKLDTFTVAMPQLLIV